MTTVVERDPPRGPWQALYAPIASEMDQVETLLREELQHEDPYIDELVRHSFKLGGKRLRPALVLLTARALGKVQPAHRLLAAVVEMIHTATLLHDDVLDEADMRRHLPTINAKWNNESSVMAGDFLFSQAFFMSATLESTFACQVIGRATNLVCAGELKQISHRGDLELPEDEYYQIIEGKTAALCACCCQLGAHYAGASPTAEAALTRFGRDLGIAFQIADDVLDLTGDSATAGKSLGSDLDKQKLTLPIIRLRDQLTGTDRARLLELLVSQDPAHRTELLSWLLSTDAVDWAREKAHFYASRARGELQVLNDSPSTEVLAAITQVVVDRRQ